MPDDSPAGTVATEALTGPDKGTQDAGTASQTPNTPTETQSASEAEDEMYKDAFDNFLAPDAKGDSKEPTKEPPTAVEDAKEPESNGPQLDDDQAQLLKRLHMDPEMIAGWTDKQRGEFLKNAAQREADQQGSYQQLKQQLDEVSKKVDGEGPPDNGSKEPAKKTDGSEAPTAGQFGTDAQKVAEKLVEDYGDEIGDAGKLLVNMGNSLDKAMSRLDEAGTRLERSETSSALKNELIVELTVESGIKDLVGDFPSLSKAKVREQVVKRFESDWRSEGSTHRKAGGTLLSRVRDALADAAKAELGTNTEQAAQVALANKTKTRLRNQPPVGGGKGRVVPKTQDDLYDQAYNEHLKPGAKR